MGLPHRNRSVFKHVTLASEAKIGVGRDGLFVSPSLRTGLADLPHPALNAVFSFRVNPC